MVREAPPLQTGGSLQGLCPWGAGWGHRLEGVLQSALDALRRQNAPPRTRTFPPANHRTPRPQEGTARTRGLPRRVASSLSSAEGWTP